MVFLWKPLWKPQKLPAKPFNGPVSGPLLVLTADLASAMAPVRPLAPFTVLVEGTNERSDPKGTTVGSRTIGKPWENGKTHRKTIGKP